MALCDRRSDSMEALREQRMRAGPEYTLRYEFGELLLKNIYYIFNLFIFINLIN